MADHHVRGDDGRRSMDPEHQLQVELLDALVQAVNDEEPPRQVTRLLGRLRDVSEAHFLSEALLMRQHSYPDYEDHIDDHARLTALIDTLGEDPEWRTPSRMAGLRQRFVQHIHERDRALEEYVDGQGGRQAQTG